MKRLSNKRYRIIIGSLANIIIIFSAYLIIQAWWTNQYNKETNNCVDMSYKLAPLFRQLGFNTSVVYGANNNSGHAWLSIDGVYFDATSLWFNDEHQYNITYIDNYPYDSMKEPAAEK